jgi:hypothetical protein
MPTNTRILAELAEVLYGTDDSAFDGVDAILTVLLVGFVVRMGTLHTAQIVAIKAIVELSTINPELARKLMVELDG